MARPFKARRVCSQPMVEVFGPLDQDAATRVELTLEEYETIRLIDLLDCTQEECAGQMGVARTTVQFCQEETGGLSGQWAAVSHTGRQLQPVPGCRQLLRQGLREAQVPETPLQ